ncbi:hypothetical protein CRG98_009770 [Punica granatum]|uniref:Uncharacterized protein n=1 Tax=Punica granatum TaxID=22663 RepID=A0A2I0KN28_PUNGR|nr:hypothetical protein CRG98_009770 [Punica granatum]
MKARAGAHDIIPFGKPPSVVLVVTISLILITVISIYPHFEYHRQPDYLEFAISIRDPPPSSSTPASISRWAPDHSAPYYTNETCMAIHEHQNCMKYGRPDSGFMKWRWKPFGCELPLFDPTRFLELARGKSMAFVGDSLARNQVQSLICLLSRVEYPKDAYTPDERFVKRWNYVTYNFTLATFTSPHLVKTNQSDPDGPAHSGIFNLYLDEIDDHWLAHIDEFDYLIISGGHWFFGSLIFYEKQQRVGCHFCMLENVPYISNFEGFRKALRTVFSAINSRKNYRGITYLRTLSPSHFEGGLWNDGGDCVRKKPFSSNETTLGGEETELYMIQKEEFQKAEAEGRKRGLMYRLLDTTQALLLRMDGHPNKYGHPPNEKWFNDCVHWCLPGPVDAWSDFLLETMKTDSRR